MEVVVVNSDIVLPGEEVLQPRKVLPLVREGTGVDVSEVNQTLSGSKE